MSVLIATFSLAAGASTAPPDDLAEIRRVATSTIEASVKADHPNAPYEIALHIPVASLAKPCSQPQIDLQGQRRYGRVPIKVRCPGADGANATGWSFYISADVSVLGQAVYARTTLARGHLIRQSDLVIRQIRLERLNAQHATTLEAVIGRRAARSLRADQPVSLQALAAPLAVRRGEHVVIESRTGAISIRTQGVALEDGLIGEQISVRNAHTERVISPWIWAPGLVGTRPHAAQIGNSSGN